jgi:hypothetical protein
MRPLTKEVLMSYGERDMGGSEEPRNGLNMNRRNFLARALSAGVLCGTGVPLPSGGGGTLTWNPTTVCPLTNPRTYNIGATGGIISLPAGQHAIVVLNGGTSIVNGKVGISGVANSGNRVRIVGGSIRNTYEGSGNSHVCLDIHNVDVAYVEGVRCDKADRFGDAFVFRGTPGGKLYLQNCLAVGVNYDRVSTTYGGTGIHGDGLQLQSQIRGLYVDKFTVYTWAQGMLATSFFDDQYVSGSAIVNGAVLKRINVRVYDTNLNPKPNPATSHTGFWIQQNCTDKKIIYKLENVYVTDEQPGTGRHTLTRLIVPGSHYSGSSACAGVVSGDAYLGTWTPSSTLGWTGFAKGGLPPDGDYVPRSFTGLNYASPGYV